MRGQGETMSVLRGTEREEREKTEKKEEREREEREEREERGERGERGERERDSSIPFAPPDPVPSLRHDTAS